MTPSKESLQAVEAWREYQRIAREDADLDSLATLIDTAYAEHRKNVLALIRVCTVARKCVPLSLLGHMDRALAALKEPHDPA